MRNPRWVSRFLRQVTPAPGIKKKMRDFVPVRRVFRAEGSDSYLARYFTGEAASRIAASGEGSAAPAATR